MKSGFTRFPLPIPCHLAHAQADTSCALGGALEQSVTNHNGEVECGRTSILSFACQQGTFRTFDIKTGLKSTENAKKERKIVYIGKKKGSA